jgi:hypothetical protein
MKVRGEREERGESEGNGRRKSWSNDSSLVAPAEIPKFPSEFTELGQSGEGAQGPRLDTNVGPSDVRDRREEGGTGGKGREEGEGIFLSLNFWV